MATVEYRTWNQGTWNTGRWNELLPVSKTHMPRVKTGAHKMKRAELLQLVTDICTKGAGKAELATSPISLADLGTAKTQTQAAVDLVTQTASNLATYETEAGEKVEDLREKVDLFAAFAGVVYKHDKAKLQAIGLDVSEAPQPLVELPAPGNLRSYTGTLDGTIDLVWNAVRRREYYEAECATEATGPWTRIYAGRKPRATCGALTPGAEYYFRVRAIGGTKGVSPWSDITRKRAA